jgi:hypothetical protein
VGSSRVSISYGGTLSPEPPRSVSLRQATLLSVDVETPVPLQELFESPVARVLRFLTLGFGRPAYVLKLTGRSDEAVLPRPDGSSSPREVEILFGTHARVDGETKPLSPHEMLFTLSDIGSRFEEMLNIWFARYDLLEPVHDLYFGTRYAEKLYPAYQVLSLAQALETYHRRVFEGTALTREDFEPIRAALEARLPASLDMEINSLFRSRIGYMNEIGLGARLRCLLGLAEPTISPYIPNSRTFVQLAVNTRNYLTHFNPDLRERAATAPVDQWFLAERFRLLLEVVLLLDVGFSSENVAALIERGGRYSHLRCA